MKEDTSDENQEERKSTWEPKPFRIDQSYQKRNVGTERVRTEESNKASHTERVRTEESNKASRTERVRTVRTGDTFPGKSSRPSKESEDRTGERIRTSYGGSRQNPGSDEEAAESGMRRGRTPASRPQALNHQKKSARPDYKKQGRQPQDGIPRQSGGGTRNRSGRNKRLKAARRRRQMILAGAAAGGILLLILLIFLARGCMSGNKTGKTADGSREALSQQGFAVTGGEDTEETGPSATPEPTRDPYADKPAIDISSWEYILANANHSIDEYTPETADFEGIQLDYRIIDAMQAFVDDTRAQGLNVFMSSGYRDYSEQSWLFEMKVAEYGEETAATIVAPPGTSEHQTGLAADITDDYYEYKNESLENTEMYKWMSAHCQEYGFIVRYPKGKEDVTGIIYEPWHFRYVGVEAATYIMEHNLTLEEFIQLYET